MGSTIGPEVFAASLLDGLGRVVTKPLAHAPGTDFQTRSGVFEEIFLVFLVLGTIIGVIVIAYSLYNAVKYRDSTDRESAEYERPPVGELPGRGEGGRKLFLSFGISAIIVVGLIAWTYGALLYVEAGPEIPDQEENLDIEIVAIEFGWEFYYPNGHMEMNELYVPVDHIISLDVSSRDEGAWHAFGAPELRVKADAIPGQTKHTWFSADETGTYDAWCFELCGVGHTTMTAEVIVLEQEEFDEWYAQTEANDDETEEDEPDDEEAEEDA